MFCRLSTVLCFVALAGVLAAWYVDQNRRNRNDITGVWYYPTPDVGPSGYWETLTIHPDGTFTKLQQYRLGSETYSGKYDIDKDGVVTFYVTSKESHVGTFDTDATFRCRVAADSRRNLIMADLDRSPSSPSTGVRVLMPEDVDVVWHCCYTEMSHDAQRDAMGKRLMEMVEDRNNAK